MRVFTIEDAVTKLVVSLEELPSFTTTYRFLASCYAHMGQLDCSPAGAYAGKAEHCNASGAVASPNPVGGSPAVAESQPSLPGDNRAADHARPALRSAQPATAPGPN
jgi:hypothetical protein